VRAGIQELSVKGETIVPEGLYRIKIKGRAGSGEIGAIVFKGGRVAGTDGRVDYAGTYALTGLDQVQANIHCTVRPGTPLVTGKDPQPYPYSFKLPPTTFPAGGSGSIGGEVFGSPVVVDISYVRGLS
jgi:hypothetical protein